jgi:hypothetical protein
MRLIPRFFRPAIEKLRDWLTFSVLQEPAAQPIYWILSSVYLFRAVYTATELGIADLLLFKAMDIEQLARKTKTEKNSLERLMQALCAFNIFKLGDNNTYENTPFSLQLLNSDENPVRNWILFSGNSTNWRSYAESTTCVQSGQSAFQVEHKQFFYDYMERDKAFDGQFRAGMNAWSQWQSAEILDAYDFGQYDFIVDVGGGRGALLSKILLANPASHGILIDSDEAVEHARAAYAALGVGERCQFLSQSFFFELPGGGNAYILKHVLRDWEDAKCREILQRCRDAMSSNSRLILIEGVLDPGQKGDRIQRCIDLEQLFWLGGQMRTLGQWSQLLDGSGFSVADVVHTTIADVSIIEAKPA